MQSVEEGVTNGGKMFRFLSGSSLIMIVLVGLSSNSFGQDVDFIEHTISDSLRWPSSVFAEDINADGYVDVIGMIADYAREIGEINWYENHDNQDFTRHLVSDSFYFGTSVMAHDIDSDGDIDIFGTSFYYADYESGEIRWWENNGEEEIGWTEKLITDEYAGARSLITSDIDGDGDDDIIAAGCCANKVCWWENSGEEDIEWLEQMITDTFYVYSIDVADVDGDGDNDILGMNWYEWDNPCVVWWENDGGEEISWTRHTIMDQFIEALEIRPADFDNDGDMDVLGMSWSGIAWWENSGGDEIQWRYHPIDEFKSADAICVEDLDGDGDIDIIGSANKGRHINGEIKWWENSGGDEVEWTDHLIADSTSANCLHICDIDSDRAPDILGARENEFTWWENNLDLGVANKTFPSEIPVWWEITSVYPNPFNSNMTAVITLHEPSYLKVSLHDFLGHKLLELANRRFTMGIHKISIDCKDLPNGVYFLLTEDLHGVKVSQAVLDLK